MNTDIRRQQIAEAGARLRAKRKAAGLIRVELWLTSDDAQRVRDFAANLEADRERKIPS